MRRALALIASVLSISSVAMAAVIPVGPDARHRTLASAVAASAHGDTIAVAPGRYSASDLKLPHDLTIEGVPGETVVSSPAPVAKGLLLPLSGTVTTVRHLIFEGAEAPDKNGAGIRLEGAGLLVENCTFRHNENGILATGNPDGFLLVRNSVFENNGHGDGRSHGLYQSHGKRIEVSGSTFIGTKIGHHVKTLATTVIVRGNRFDDQDGEPSYLVDATRGGRVYIDDNEIIRRASASQQTLFNYDTSRGGSLGKISIRQNRITTERGRTNLLNAPEGAERLFWRNTLTTKGRGAFRDLPEEGVRLTR